MQVSGTFTKNPLEVGIDNANSNETRNDTWLRDLAKQDLQEGPEHWFSSEIPHNFSPLVF